MRREAHVLALGLLSNLKIGGIALGGIPNLLLSPEFLSVSGGGCPALENQDTVICRRVEDGTVSRIELERNPFIETLVVKVDPFLNPASFLVSPT